MDVVYKKQKIGVRVPAMTRPAKLRKGPAPLTTSSFVPVPSNSLERALKILEMIGAHQGGLSNKEISRDLRVATSSCSYILSRLERNGYLARNEVTGRYEIGLKVLALVRGPLQQMHFRRVAEPVLRRLAADTGLEAVIGVLDQDRLLLINRVPSGEFAKLDVDIGSEFPVHATAIGKALLAYCPEEQILHFIERKRLIRLTPKTITSASSLLTELERVRKRGYSISDGEQRPDLRAIASPIIDSKGGVCAAVAVTGTIKQPAWGEIGAVVQLVKSAGREISRLARLG
jgi:DNA-binding IclR family transcriptional regulator